jgi:hypothetical protein
LNGNTYFIQDDRVGNLNLWQQGIGVATTIVRTVGTVDYTKGVIKLNEFMPYTGDASGTVSLIVSSANNDVLPSLNNILFIKPEDISVVAVPIAITV